MSSAQSEEELNKFLRGHRVLQMGLAFYRSHRISIKGLIHHSDRGAFSLLCAAFNAYFFAAEFAALLNK